MPTRPAQPPAAAADEEPREQGGEAELLAAATADAAEAGGPERGQAAEATQTLRARWKVARHRPACSPPPGSHTKYWPSNSICPPQCVYAGRCCVERF